MIPVRMKTQVDKKRTKKRLSGILIFLVFLVLVNIILLVVNRSVFATEFAFISQVIFTLVSLMFAVVGSLILIRQRRNLIGLLLMVFPVMLTLSSVLDFYFAAPLAQANTLDIWLFLYIWFSGWSWWLLIGPLLLIFLLFPTGHLLSKRWRWAVLLLGAAFALFLFLATFAGMASSLNTGQTWPSPIGFLSEPAVELLVAIMSPMLLVSVVASVVSVFLRYRRAQAIERAQLRWLFFAGLIFLVGYIPGGSLSENDALAPLFNILFAIGLLSVPIAIGIAILKYRLWDIDFVINRSLVYGLLTALLGAIFAGTAALVAQLAKTLFGAELESASAAVAALTVAALFQPLRTWVEGVINRRLFPENIDMAQGLIEIQPELWAWVPLPKMLGATLSHLEEIYLCETSAIYLKRAGSFQPAVAHGLSKAQLPTYRPGVAEENSLKQKKSVASENEKPFVLTVPIYLPRRKEAELLGVLRLGKRKEGRGYSGDDAKTLVAFGAKLALPIYALSGKKKTQGA